jgi:hypothetical protein
VQYFFLRGHLHLFPLYLVARFYCGFFGRIRAHHYAGGWRRGGDEPLPPFPSPGDLISWGPKEPLPTIPLPPPFGDFDDRSIFSMVDFFRRLRYLFMADFPALGFSFLVVFGVFVLDGSGHKT